mgnify:CR=1 FL=1
MQHIVSLSTIFHHHFVQTNSIICFICVKEENLHVMYFSAKIKIKSKLLNEKKNTIEFCQQKKEKTEFHFGYFLEHFLEAKMTRINCHFSL